MALAANLRQYSPPKRIQQMEADLAPLAHLWQEGPWGWSLATKRRYQQMGVPLEALPTDEWIAEVRRLSSREFACGYLHNLLRELDDDRLLGKEMTFHTDLSLPSAEERIYKSPWSSSGRGVFISTNLTDEQIRTRLQGFLRTQGGYVSDRFYADKTLDCAMEFWVHPDHHVEFLGYSVFHTEPNGSYAYNLVDSQEYLRSLIAVDDDLLSRLIDYHKTHLGQTAYHGPVGIDMLLTEEIVNSNLPNSELPNSDKIVNSKLFNSELSNSELPNCDKIVNSKLSNSKYLHSVVEINFRMNMGILAILLYNKYGPNATVQLTPSRTSGFSAHLTNGKLQIDFRQ
jgi:hypothetical protein